MIEQGEDAFFTTEMGMDVGVFDGVGSWVDRGVDAGVYTRTLSSFMAAYINKRRKPETSELSRDQQEQRLAVDGTNGLTSSSFPTTTITKPTNTKTKSKTTITITPTPTPATTTSTTTSTLTLKQQEPQPQNQQLQRATMDDIDLKDGLRKSCKKVENLAGSTTACIVSLNSPVAIANILNIGDSGVIIFRTESSSSRSSNNNKNDDNSTSTSTSRCEIVFQSKHMYHSFNLPYQIGNDPDSSKQRPSLFDAVSDGMLSFVPIKERDIVIVASDGLFDNVFVADMQEIVEDVVGKWQRKNSGNGDVSVGSKTGLSEPVTRTLSESGIAEKVDEKLQQQQQQQVLVSESEHGKVRETKLHSQSGLEQSNGKL